MTSIPKQPGMHHEVYARSEGPSRAQSKRSSALVAHFRVLLTCSHFSLIFILQHMPVTQTAESKRRGLSAGTAKVRTRLT